MALTAGADNVNLDSTHAIDVQLIPISISQALATDGTHRRIEANSASGNVSLTLPSAATSAGITYFVKRSVSPFNDINIVPNGSDEIDGNNANYSLTIMRNWVEIISNGTEWVVIGHANARDEMVFKSLADLTPFLVATSYELPAGRYVFDSDIDLGTNNISLIDGAFYTFKFSDINQITYTGTGAMFDAQVSGTAIKMDDGFLNAPNASEALLMANGNSLILTLVIIVAPKAATLTDMSFVTLNDLPLVGCDDGIECINCGTITAKLLQWNSGSDSAGTALRVTGAGSERLIMTTSDARPMPTEFYLDIDSTYGGKVSVNGGVLDAASGGTFFKGAPSMNQAAPAVEVSNIVGVASSKSEAFSHISGNATATIISTVNTPVKVNAGAGWSDEIRERFNFDSSGIWTYVGLEEIDFRVSFIATVDPSGGTDEISTYLAKNGTVQANTQGTGVTSSGTQITCTGIISMVTNDFLEVFIENNNDTSNITVSVATFLGAA